MVLEKPKPHIVGIKIDHQAILDSRLTDHLIELSGYEMSEHEMSLFEMSQRSIFSEKNVHHLAFLESSGPWHWLRAQVRSIRLKVTFQN